jgi:ketosteroid isomerase-like protein
MSREYAEGVLEGYELFNRGELETALEGFHSEIVWEVPDIFPEAEQVYHGHEGVRRFWTSWQEVFPSFRIEVEEAIDVDEQVIVMARVLGRGRDSGAEVSSPCFPHIWTIRNSLATHVKMLPTRASALEYVGITAAEAESRRVPVPPGLGSGVHLSA